MLGFTVSSDLSVARCPGGGVGSEGNSITNPGLRTAFPTSIWLPAPKPTRLQEPLCLEMFQSTEQPTTHPDLTQLVAFTSEMTSAHQTASSIALSIYTEPEELPPALQAKKSLQSVASWLASRSRRYPFLFATALYLVLMGIIATITWLHPENPPSQNVIGLVLDDTQPVASFSSMSLSPLGSN